MLYSLHVVSWTHPQAIWGDTEGVKCEKHWKMCQISIEYMQKHIFLILRQTISLKQNIVGLKGVVLFECSILNSSTSFLGHNRRCQVRTTLKEVSNLVRIHAKTHFLDFETNNFFKTYYCGTKRCCTLYMWYHELIHKLFGAIPKVSGAKNIEKGVKSL